MDGQETMDHSAAVAVTEAAYQRRHDQKRARRAEERDAPSLPRDQRRVSKWKQYERDTTDANFRKAAAFECSCSLHSCASITLQLFEQCAQMRFNMEQDKSKDNPVDRRLLKMLVPARCYDPRDEMFHVNFNAAIRVGTSAAAVDVCPQKVCHPATGRASLPLRADLYRAAATRSCGFCFTLRTTCGPSSCGRCSCLNCRCPSGPATTGSHHVILAC